MRNMSGLSVSAVCGSPGQALRTVGRAPIGGFFRLKYRGGFPTMSHVIPLWLVQTLNLYRWNCNVCGLSRKMTELNYVRNVDGGAFSVMRVGAAVRLSGPSGAACASSWLDGRCVLPDLPPFYGIVSASNIPGPLVLQGSYVFALNAVTAGSQFRTT